MKDLTDPTNRDTVPAMLTPGEFVLNKEASEMYAPYIEQMNNHGLQVREQKNMGGEIPTQHFSLGGKVELQEAKERQKARQRAEEAGEQRVADWFEKRGANDPRSPLGRGYEWRNQPNDEMYVKGMRSEGGSRTARKVAPQALQERVYKNYNALDDPFIAEGGLDSQFEKWADTSDYNTETLDEPVYEPIRGPKESTSKKLSNWWNKPRFKEWSKPRGGFKNRAHKKAWQRQEDEARREWERGFKEAWPNGYNKNDGGMIPMNYNGIPPQHLNIGGWLGGLFKQDEERQAELQGVANRQADMEMLNSTNTQAVDQYGQQIPAMNDLPIPNSDESLLQGSSGSVENAKMAQANIPMPEQAAPPMELPVGSPERMAAIEAGEIEPNDEDFAYEEQMYNKTQELDLLRKQQAVTASDSPQAMFQQEREQNLTNDINALMQPPELGGPPPELESGSLDFATAEEGLPEFDPGVIPGMEAPELPEGYEQIVTDTPISKADSNIRLDVAQLKKDSMAQSTEADEMAVEAEQGIRNAKSANEIERFQRMADNAKQQKSEAEAGLAQAENQQAQITERDGVADENAQAIYDSAENRDDLRAQRTAALESIGATPNEDDMPDPLAKENTPVTKAKVTQIMQEAEMGEPLSEPEAAKAVSAGKTATPEQAAKGESAIKEAFGDLFDKKELARAGLMFAGALLTGMSPQRALAFAGQGYIKRIDGKEAIRVKNASDLAKAQAKGAANQKSILDMTNPEPYLVDGERVNTFVLQSTDANGNKVKTRVTANGQPIPPDSHQNFDTVPGTSEYNKRVHTESKTYSTAFKELQGRFGESKGKEGETQYATDLTPSKVGANTAKWAIKNGVPPEAVTQILDNAYSSARNDSKKGNKTKNIEAYLNAEYLQTKTGSAQLFEGAEPTQVNSVLNNLSESSGGKTPTQIMQFARGKWNEETEDVKESYRRRTPDGSTPFLEYLKSINSGER